VLLLDEPPVHLDPLIKMVHASAHSASWLARRLRLVRGAFTNLNLAAERWTTRRSVLADGRIAATRLPRTDVLNAS